MRYISGTKLDERIIRCDLDLGYKEGRQFGRGKSGGQVRILPDYAAQHTNLNPQVRDEYRQDYDPGRGGWGAQARRREVEERYADAEEGPGAVAQGGGDWKEPAAAPAQDKKRGRSPEDEGENARMVRPPSFIHGTNCLCYSGCSRAYGRRRGTYVAHVGPIILLYCSSCYDAS